MNRRGFLAGLGALIGGIAIEEAIPFGRVWSFPKEVKCVNFCSDEYSIAYNRALNNYLSEYTKYMESKLPISSRFELVAQHANEIMMQKLEDMHFFKGDAW